MHKELRQRLAKEYGYAVNKMQEVNDPAKKLFYFTVFFSEAQRDLNWEWDRDLVLVLTITQYVHTQFTNAMQIPGMGVLPIDWVGAFNKLTQVSIELASYYDKEENDKNRAEIYQVLGHMAEIAYVVSGNGSYLSEKGLIKL
jgi:hypothetical protein